MAKLITEVLKSVKWTLAVELAKHAVTLQVVIFAGKAAAKEFAQSGQLEEVAVRLAHKVMEEPVNESV